MGLRLSRPTLMLATALALTGARSGKAYAQDGSAQLGSIEKQIQALQAELRHMKTEMTTRNRELRAARGSTAYQAPSPAANQPLPINPQIPAGYALVPAVPGTAGGSLSLVRIEKPRPLPQGTFQVGDATVKLGGFIEAASIFRSRNEVTDVASSYNTIPLNYQVQGHETEFHESARQSRVFGTVEEDPDEVTKLRANVTVDFLGAAPTSNYNESNSWTPRLREAWAAYDRKDWGFELFAGQSWSMVVPDKVGIDPANVVIPLTVDAQYVPGFNWARQPGLRLAKSFADGQYWLEAGIESSATTYSQTSIPSALGTLNVSNPGVGVDGNGSNSTTSVNNVTTTTTGGKTTTTTTATTVLTPGLITDDIAPDVIIKGTADYNLGHLEAFGLGRVFHDRVSQLGTGESNTQFGGGGGGSAVIHVVQKMLDFQVSGLAGQGIGRYGAGQLPDATVNSRGGPEALPEWTALVGLVGHPEPSLDTYAYLGTEQSTRRSFNVTKAGKISSYGYGNPLYNNTGCETELASASTCVANTQALTQGTAGFWYKFVHGQFGTMEIGPQYSFTHRAIFQGEGKTPSANENTFFLSFRYYPFQ